MQKCNKEIARIILMHFYFYLIFCKNVECTDIYIGHAVDIRTRITLHKYSANKPEYGKSKLYTTIRNNGGWENWDYKILCEFDFPSEREANIKEQELFDEFKPSLNTCRAVRLPKDHPITIAKAKESMIKHKEKKRQKNLEQKEEKELQKPEKVDGRKQEFRNLGIKMTPEEYAEKQKESKKKWYDKVKNKKIEQKNLEEIAVDSLLNLNKIELLSC
jgi:predicted GIY-YIG superfamily endonuclease